MPNLFIFRIFRISQIKKIRNNIKALSVSMQHETEFTNTMDKLEEVVCCLLQIHY